MALLGLTLGVCGAVGTLAPRPALAQEFRLMPDDALSVQVSNHPEMSVPKAVVDGSGRISVPFVGDVPVAGKTLSDVQRVLTKAFRSQLRAPQVTIGIVQARPRQINVLGLVKRPGAVNLQPGWRVSESLGAVGGLIAPVEDVAATLVRGKGAPIGLDLAQITKTPQKPGNPALRLGDVINVVALPAVRVGVTGDVVMPSENIELRRNPRVLDAIRAARGLHGSAQQTRGTLARANGQKIILDLPAIFGNEGNAANLLLQSDDLLSFEAIATNVAVMSPDNLVKSPGTFDLGGDATAIRALAKAGGLTVPGTGAVASVRRGSQVFNVDLDRAFADPSQDVALRDGDILLLSYPNGPQITLTGTVDKPGTMHLKEGGTLRDALVRAGDLTIKPDAANITVLRALPDGKQVTFNINAPALFNGSDPSQNLRLQNGDFIVVGEAVRSQTVFVAGEVKAPGAFEVGVRDSLSEVVLRAGGPSKLAALSRVTLTRRGGAVQVFDLSRAGQSDAPAVNVPLQAGDIINVPRNERQVMVMNAVNAPGNYPVPEGGALTLGDALLAAGGPRAGANLKQVTILRRGGGDVQKQVVSLADFGKTTAGARQLAIDTPLQPGDVVFVPELSNKPSVLRAAAGTLASVTTLLRFGTLF